jgi:predicted AlkP superfamily phosphohydrolase/phosphomutase
VFNLVADLQGYIRINLKGREKEGIVEEGEEYDELCNRLIHGLMTFKDSETLEPIIDKINRKDKLFNKNSGYNYLPDILVNWKDKPASSYRKIVSPHFGEIEWPMPEQNPDGRSGNHRPQGFFIAKGKNYAANSVIENKHIVDLAPTFLHHLDLPRIDGMKGGII